jgi:hypothetical protein
MAPHNRSSSSSSDNMRQLAQGEQARKRGWADLDRETQQQLLSGMPPEVRIRLKRGETLTEREVEEYVRKYYDFGRRVVLYKIPLPDNTDPEARPLEMRDTAYDAFLASKRAAFDKMGAARFEGWGDAEFLSMGAPPPKGYRWEAREERRVVTGKWND